MKMQNRVFCDVFIVLGYIAVQIVLFCEAIQYVMQHLWILFSKIRPEELFFLFFWVRRQPMSQKDGKNHGS